MGAGITAVIDRRYSLVIDDLSRLHRNEDVVPIPIYAEQNRIGSFMARD